MSSLSHKKDLPRKTRKALNFKIGLIGTITMLLLLSLPAHAERKQYYGFSIDGSVGATNQIGSSSFSTQSFKLYYAAYPSVSLSSVGEHSTFDINYNFLAERFEIDPATNNFGHILNLSYNAKLSERVRFRLYDYFDNASDYGTVNVLKGIEPIPSGGFQYIFEPQLYLNSNVSNTSGIGFDVDLNERSYLTFNAVGSFRIYTDEPVLTSYLNDQTRVEGDIGYTYKQSDRTSWNVMYRIWQNDYDYYPLTRAHSLTLNLSHQLTPNTVLTLGAGPVYVEANDTYDSEFSYEINAYISRKFKTNRIYAGYSHYAADSTGLGGATDSDQVSGNFSQNIGQKIVLNFQASYFNQEFYDYNGFYGALAISRRFGKSWVASVGGSYGWYDTYSYKRIYGSIGYRFNTKPVADTQSKPNPSYP